MSESKEQLIASLIEKHTNYCYEDYNREEHRRDSEDLANELYDLLAPKWVSVAELPKESGKYLVYGSYAKDTPKQVFEALYDLKSKRFRTDIWSKNVTHWTPLPQPPKEKP